MTAFTICLLSCLHAALTPLATCATAHNYQDPMDGVCRGPGGDTDKINSRHVKERSSSDCRKDCDAMTHCKGYSYHPEANGGECILHGPGMAGSCSDITAKSPAECAALGHCKDTPMKSQKTCGSCTEASATDEDTCKSVVGTWTKHTWKSAGATWNDAEDPWTGEWHHSVIIKGSVASSGYKCYDVDASDHEAKCTGSSPKCEAAFKDKAEELQISTNCPDGCTFTAKVAGAATPKVPHAPALALTGYNAKAGACRGPDNSKVNGKYSNTAGASGKLTEQECHAACEAEAECLGYAHSTAWCVVYGPGIDETPGAKWTSDKHASTTITGTKPNIAYICQVKSKTSVGQFGDVSGTTELYPRFVSVLASMLIFSIVWKP